MATTLNGEKAPLVQIAPDFTNIIMSEKDRGEAVKAAHWITCSPCEWTWTKEQQALMAQYCLWAAQRMQAILDLAEGIPLERANSNEQKFS